MTNFDYRQQSTELLMNHLRVERSHIELKESQCRRLEKEIQNRRGYSDTMLNVMAHNLKTYTRMVEIAKKEALAIEAVIMERVA